MSDIQSGETFVDGQTVNSARLNNDLSSAVIQPSVISGKPAITPLVSDFLLVYEAASDSLKKSLISSLLALGGQGTVTSVGLSLPAGWYSVSGSPVTSSGVLTATPVSQIANTILAGPPSGGNGAPSFRPLIPADFDLPAFLVPAFQIDWSVSNTFLKGIVGNATFTFLNVSDGRSIKVKVQNNGLFTVTWPAGVRWSGGTQPVQTLNTDLWTFTVFGSTVLGEHIGNYI